MSLACHHECLACGWLVWSRAGPGISEGDEEDQGNSIIKRYFTAAYDSCWNQWEHWRCAACHPQHWPCPSSHQGHLTPAPAGSADLRMHFSYCCPLSNPDRGRNLLFMKKLSDNHFRLSLVRLYIRCLLPWTSKEHLQMLLCKSPYKILMG